MQPSRWDLSVYRLERAQEDLRAARINLESNLYKAAVNRSYYSIFHAIRSVNVLDDFDASKHSSVIAHFNQYHVHTGDFEKETSKLLIQHTGFEKNATILIFLWFQEKKRLLEISPHVLQQFPDISGRYF